MASEIKVAECKNCGRKIRKINGDWEHFHSAMMSCHRTMLGDSAQPKRGTVKWEGTADAD